MRRSRTESMPRAPPRSVRSRYRVSYTPISKQLLVFRGCRSTCRYQTLETCEADALLPGFIRVRCRSIVLCCAPDGRQMPDLLRRACQLNYALDSPMTSVSIKNCKANEANSDPGSFDSPDAESSVPDMVATDIKRKAPRPCGNQLFLALSPPPPPKISRSSFSTCSSIISPRGTQLMGSATPSKHHG